MIVYVYKFKQVFKNRGNNNFVKYKDEYKSIKSLVFLFFIDKNYFK